MTQALGKGAFIVVRADDEAGYVPTGASVAGSTGETAVAIKDFAYDTASVAIPVGGSVTWTNNDPAPHTATAQDRAVLQSGTLEQGASFTQTFTTAGTFEYFCEFHPNMKATVVVQ